MFARIRSQLHWRLSLVLMALFVLFALLAVAILRQFSITHEQEVAQRMNRDVAMYIARQQTVAAPTASDANALAELFRYVMIVNPSLNVYLLDTQGRVRGYDSGRGPLVRQQVPLDPVHAFLRGKDPLPIRGADPRGAADVVFSAAAVGDPSRPTGYVYAVLGGAAQSGAALGYGSFGLSAALLSFAIVVLFLGVTGALLFRSLTARLRHLARRVDQFEEGRFVAPQPAAVDTGGDELARLTQAFDAMAAKIAAQFAQIESIDLSRREAVLNASHDLRTPLAALQGYLQTLQIKADALSVEQRASYIAIAQRHAARMSVLVEQMFALAKLDAPETAPKCEAFALAELAGDIVQKYRLRAAEQGVVLTAAVDTGAPPMWADISMIERLIENLVDNALKFTASGGTVRVEVRADDEASALVLSVADSGCGIADEDLPHIFERFERGGAAARGEIVLAGSGLGLAIVRRIVDLHGAALEVVSRVGEGTRFTVRFLLQVSPTRAASGVT